MAKIFYTERDIEDMTRRGEKSLVINDNVVLTDLAYEAARRLGVELVQPHDNPPAAPVRPYLNKDAAQSVSTSGVSSSSRLETIKQRVRSAVKARLGSQLDDAVLDRIIERVVVDLGLK